MRETLKKISVSLVILPLLGVMMLNTAASGTRAAVEDFDAGGTFKAKCAMCHGQDATGNTPMGKNFKIRDLTSADVQKQTDAELTTIITKGKNKMPEFGTKLTKDQIADLGKYIRGLKK